MLRRVLLVVALCVAVLLLFACSKDEVEGWAQNIWIGYTLPESGRNDGTGNRRIWRVEDHEAVIDAIEEGKLYADEPLNGEFVIAMSNLLRGRLIPAFEEFDRLEQAGFSRARLLHRAAMLGIQSDNWSQRRVLEETILHHLDEGESLNQSEIDLLLLGLAKFNWESTAAAMLPGDSNLELGREIFQTGRERLEHSLSISREEPLRAILKWTDNRSIGNFEVEAVQAATDRFSPDLIAYYMASYYSDPAHRDLEKVENYLARAGSIEVLKVLDLMPWIIAVSNLIDAAILVDRYDLAEELLSIRSSSDIEDRMRSHSLLKEAAVAAGRGMYEKSLEFLQIQVSDAVIYPTGSSRESVPQMILLLSKADLLYLLTAVYLLYDEFDDMLATSYGNRVAEVFAGRFEEIESPSVLRGNGM